MKAAPFQTVNGKGVAESYFLELLPVSSHPTIFIEAYCYALEDMQFLDKTCKKIVKLLNAN